MLPSLAALALQTDAGQKRKRTLDEAMPDGFSMLCRAAQDNDLEGVRDLLNNGARVDNAPHKTPLMIASKNGNAEIVKLLLEHGARVDRLSYDGNTPLVIASEEGHTEIVNLLLEGGAKVDTVSRFGQTPLMIACEERHFEIVKLLIEHGADLEATTYVGYTPLMYSIQFGVYLDLPMIKLLLDSGANPNAVPADVPTEVPEDERGGWMTSTPLMYACDSSFIKDSPWSLVDVVWLLLRHGADPNRVNGNGETALSLSILRYRHEVVAYLLDYGVIVTDAAVAAFATTAADMENWELRLRDEGASLAELQNLRETETRWSDIASRLSLYIPEDSPLHPEFTRIFRAMIEHKQRIGFIPVTK